MSRVRAPFPAPEIDKFVAGWSSLVARRAHNPEVAGSNPAPATILRRPTLGARPRSSVGSSASMVRMRSSVRFRSRAPGFKKLSARGGAEGFLRFPPCWSARFIGHGQTRPGWRAILIWDSVMDCLLVKTLCDGRLRALVPDARQCGVRQSVCNADS